MFLLCKHVRLTPVFNKLMMMMMMNRGVGWQAHNSFDDDYLTTVADTIRYDSVYLTCSKKLTDSQLSLPHGKRYITMLRVSMDGDMRIPLTRATQLDVCKKMPK